MDEQVIRPGERFLHSFFVEVDLRTPLTMVVTNVQKEAVYFTSAELYDAGYPSGTWRRGRDHFKSSVLKWLT